MIIHINVSSHFNAETNRQTSQVEVFWVMMTCSSVVWCWLHPEDGANIDLWNVGILP